MQTKNPLMHRLAVLVTLLGMSASAHANVEIGGTAGVHIFSESNKLGAESSNTMPTSESNTSMFGFRLGDYFTPKLGVELELGFLPDEPRSMVFDLYNLTYRAQLVYQFRTEEEANAFIPFALGGAGLMQIVSSKNTAVVAKDKELEVYVGGGVKYKAPGDWGVRADIRVIIVPKLGGGVTEDFEGLLSLYKEFGRKKVEKKKEVAPPPTKTDDDPDKDGIVGAADKCPNEAEDKDGFEDADGCPDLDNDKDGIPDATDKCPNEAEDKDGFEDADGCPDPDNDKDGIPDATDKCPNEAETQNGFQDADGCPDQIPEKLKKFTGAIQGITFQTGSAELAPASFKILDQALAVLVEFKDVKLEIQGHTDDVPLKDTKKFKDNTALSQARADSVKAYFVKKGVEDARLTSRGYGDAQPVEDPKTLKGPKLNAARGRNRRVEFKLMSAMANPGAIAAPPTTPAPAPAP